MESPILKTFQPLERKSALKAVDKPVEPEIQVPRRPVVPPPQPPVGKLPVRIASTSALEANKTRNIIKLELLQNVNINVIFIFIIQMSKEDYFLTDI